MQNVTLQIAKKEKVSKDIFLMTLIGDLSEIKNFGEFINLTLPGYFLRRPISVCDFSKDHVDILFKILGHGTKDLSEFEIGAKLDVLVGLGNGFTIRKDIHPVLVGGGIGIAPLVGLAREYNRLGIKPTLIYGARSKDDLSLIPTLEELCDVNLCTDDGSLGFKGNVVDCIKSLNLNIDYYYACGPYRMLEALTKAYPNGCVSMEARMGCGFGACMGCSIQTTKGPQRVCKEGPVFDASEVIF